MKKTIALFLLVLVLGACANNSLDTEPSSSLAAESQSEPSSSLTSESQSEVSETSKFIGIKGSNLTDIPFTLEISRFEFPSPVVKPDPNKKFGEYYVDKSKYIRDLGISFDYEIYADSNYSVVEGVFQLKYLDHLIDPPDFLLLSKLYLGLCAAIPCDATSGDLSGIAKTWVEFTIDNISDYESGTSIIWDDAYFQLNWVESIYGDVSRMWLVVKRVEPS